MQVEDLKQLVRTIPDYPRQGILFRDITSLLVHGEGFQATIAALTEPYYAQGIKAVAGIEARGFILGGAIADKLGVGFIPIRKKGKLPGSVISESYQLEYGMDTVEIHTDAIERGERVLLVDDLIATGGTALAALALLETLGAQTIGAAFVIDLPDLGGLDKLASAGVGSHTLMQFEGT